MYLAHYKSWLNDQTICCFVVKVGGAGGRGQGHLNKNVSNINSINYDYFLKMRKWKQCEVYYNIVSKYFAQMNEPRVFILTFKLFECEKVSTENGTRMLLESMEDLYLEIKSCDVVLLAPISTVLLPCMTRIISGSLSFSTCQIIHFKKVKSALKLLNILLHSISGLTSTSRNAIYTKSGKDINNLFLLVTTTLESLKGSIDQNRVEDEELCVSCFEYYNSTIQLWHDELSLSLPNALSGPFLAQIIQCTLFFGKHRSKEVSQLSIACLRNLVSVVGDGGLWRTFFPGIFSGLYAVCKGGYKR
jgi:hypothetical protein